MATEPTGALPPSQPAPRTPFSLHPRQDKVLAGFETVLVISLAFVILSATIFSLVWIGSGWPHLIAERFAQLLATLNKSWKICLVIIIPLAFRPLRVFLENLESIGVAKRFSQPTSGEGKPIPPTTSTTG